MRSNQFLDEQQPIIFKKSLHHILHLIQYRKSFIWLVKYFLNFPTFAFFIMIWHFKSWKQGNKETNFCQCSFDISHPSRDQDIANTIITERILITGILLLHIVGALLYSLLVKSRWLPAFCHFHSFRSVSAGSWSGMRWTAGFLSPWGLCRQEAGRVCSPLRPGTSPRSRPGCWDWR